MTNLATQAPVLVTGASGYIASWVIQKLLTQGYTVHATTTYANKMDFFNGVFHSNKFSHSAAITCAAPNFSCFLDSMA